MCACSLQNYITSIDFSEEMNALELFMNGAINYFKQIRADFYDTADLIFDVSTVLYNHVMYM